MVRFLRTAKISAGNAQNAVGWAMEVAEYVTKLTGTRIQVFTQFGGEFGSIHWMGDYENLAAMEAALNKLNADAGYWDIVAPGAELLIEGQSRDTIFMSV